MPKDSAQAPRPQDSLADFYRTMYFMAGAAVIDAFLVFLASKYIALPIALLLAFAATTIGVIIGFLFGIPPVAKEEAAGAAQNPAAARRRRLMVNTNLEEISNWLTKVLVGASLVQLQSLPGALHAIAEAINPGTNDPRDVATVTVCILLSSAIFGFFLGYLTTRLFLAGAFDRAEGSDDVEEGLATVVAGAVVAKNAVVVAAPPPADAELPASPPDVSKPS